VQWGDNIGKFGITEGETITAHIDLQSRESNGRWYTDVKAWRVERPDESGAAPPAPDGEPWPESSPEGRRRGRRAALLRRGAGPPAKPALTAGRTII